MGEAHLVGVVGERVGELAVGEPALAVRAAAPPGAEVHLVDGDRRVERALRPPPRHPGAVAPLVLEGRDAGARARRLLGVERERVGLLDDVARARLDPVLVAVAARGAGHEALEDPRPRARAQRVARRVPAVPVADHGHARGVRRPHREVRAGPALLLARVGAELLPEPEVAPFVEEVEVVVAEERGRGPPGGAFGHGDPGALEPEVGAREEGLEREAALGEGLARALPAVHETEHARRPFRRPPARRRALRGSSRRSSSCPRGAPRSGPGRRRPRCGCRGRGASSPCARRSRRASAPGRRAPRRRAPPSRGAPRRRPCRPRRRPRARP